MNSNTGYDSFVSKAEIGYIVKAIDMYSRRGAENAKEDG
jgi:hypothetical protein